MIDFSIFYKTFSLPEVPVAGSWDIFVSAYDKSDRVLRLFDLVTARKKYWVLLPEYHLSGAPPQGGDVIAGSGDDEISVLSDLLSKIGDGRGKSICIDLTGFLNNYVLCLLGALKANGVSDFVALYGEPVRYKERERTKFSEETVSRVGLVSGYEGTHSPNTSDDVLVMGVGYDHKLVTEVANHKEHAKKIQLFGFPALRVDMYQESMLGAYKAATAVGPLARDQAYLRFAPANDPFITAEVLCETIGTYLEAYPNANIYLAPLATKVQALGFGLYYLFARHSLRTSVLFAYCGSHETDTAEGLARVCTYNVELQLEEAK